MPETGGPEEIDPIAWFNDVFPGGDGFAHWVEWSGFQPRDRAADFGATVGVDARYAWSELSASDRLRALDEFRASGPAPPPPTADEPPTPPPTAEPEAIVGDGDPLAVALGDVLLPDDDGREAVERNTGRDTPASDKSTVPPPGPPLSSAHELDSSYFFNTGNASHELKFGIRRFRKPILIAVTATAGVLGVGYGYNALTDDDPSPAGTTDAVEVVDDADAGGSDTGFNASVEDGSGETILEFVACRSDTDGCDPKGDPEIIGFPSPEVAAGADLTNLAAGYAFNDDGSPGRQQIQISFAGMSDYLQMSEDTSRFELRIDGMTADGPFSIVLTSMYGSPFSTSVTDIDGATVEEPDPDVRWLDHGPLWVDVDGVGATSGSTETTVEVTAEAPNADGSPGAVITDDASG